MVDQGRVSFQTCTRAREHGADRARAASHRVRDLVVISGGAPRWSWLHCRGDFGGCEALAPRGRGEGARHRDQNARAGRHPRNHVTQAAAIARVELRSEGLAALFVPLFLTGQRGHAPPESACRAAPLRHAYLVTPAYWPLRTKRGSGPVADTWAL